MFSGYTKKIEVPTTVEGKTEMIPFDVYHGVGIWGYGLFISDDASRACEILPSDFKKVGLFWSVFERLIILPCLVTVSCCARNNQCCQR